MTIPDGYTDVPAGKIAAVVTALAMHRAPASGREAAVESGWTLRAVPRADLGWYRDLYRRVGEDWLWFSRLRLGDAALAALVHDPDVEVHALDVRGTSEGLLELDFRIPGECELAFLGLTPAMLGRGAGRLLMAHALKRAWARPISRFWVHTCTLDHPAALAFYVKAGFTPFRRQIEVADDPRLTGEAPRTAAAQVPLIEPPA